MTIKPWEEDWEYISGGWPYDVHRKGTNDKIADVWATGIEDGNGTADLIAQAPAMARLLLRLMDDDEADDILVPGGKAVCEYSDAVRATLRAAGVLAG